MLLFLSTKHFFKLYFDFIYRVGVYDMASEKFTDNRTDAEFFAEIMAKYPPYTEAVYAYAINAALQAKAAAHGIEVENVGLEDINRASNSSKTGLSVGVGKNKHQTSLWVRQHPPVTKDVTRNGKVVGSYEVAPMTATANTFIGGGFSNGNALDVGSYLAEANLAVGQAFTPNETPAQIAARLAEQKEITASNERRRQEIAGVEQIGADLTDTLKEYTTALLQAEYQGLVALNEHKGIAPSDLHYPQKKHKGKSDEFINKTYQTSVAMPEKYNFLNVGEPSEDPSVKAIAKNDRMAVELQTNEVIKEHLHTTAAHLKVVDYMTSLDDDPHPLIGQYEEKYGKIRDLTSEEMSRVNLLEGKMPPVPEDKKTFGEDGKEIKPEFKFHEKNMFVGGISVNDIGKPDPKIVSGQVFYADLKISPKNTNITGIVNVVGGDPAKPIDEIYVAEGVATATAMEELIENATKFEPEKYDGKNILVLSTYNSNNFIESTKMLHHNHPDIPINAIGDNDIKVRLESGSGRPILDEDGGFQYIARNNESYISSKDLPTNQEDQRLALKVNAGADACHELNTYFIDNPNRDADGKPIAPMAAAFIVNKGQGGLNSFIIKQQSPNVDSAMPENQRLLNPKVDLNDVVENAKNLLRNKLKAQDATLAAEGKPKIKIEDKLNNLSDLQFVLKKGIIDKPIESVRNNLQDLFFKRLDLNRYDNTAVEPETDVSAKAIQDAASTAALTRKEPMATAQRPTSIVDEATPYAIESKASSYAKKYGGGFMIPDAPATPSANDNKIEDPSVTQQRNNVQASSPRP